MIPIVDSWFQLHIKNRNLKNDPQIFLGVFDKKWTQLKQKMEHCWCLLITHLNCDYKHRNALLKIMLSVSRMPASHLSRVCVCVRRVLNNSISFHNLCTVHCANLISIFISKRDTTSGKQPSRQATLIVVTIACSMFHY